MKTKYLLLPLLAVVLAFAGEKASALDIGFGVGVGGRHHNDGGSFSFRTSDPTYTTYYPSTTTYVYRDPYYYQPSYYYRSDSYDTWHGNDRYRRHWNR